jgi:prephenate dehydratase
VGNGIYYLGPLGSYTHEASLILKGKKISKQTISEVFYEVSKNNSKGIVPIENSREGPINETLDNLFKYDNVYVNYEKELNINIVIASNKNIKDFKEIKRIYSNYYAIQEAKDILLKIDAKEIIQVESTSKAALLASKDKEGAALCSSYAAKIYKLKILQKNVQDGINITRFIIISSKMKKNGDKTMVFFIVKHKPGSLYNVLKVFYKNNINLTMIYSRPLKEKIWNYYFYVEFEGNLIQKNIKRALNSISAISENLKIKGSFFKV